MATRYAQGAINWSAGPWYDAASGGSAASTPSVGDTADANGQTVAIDQEINVALLRNNATSGGIFALPANAAQTLTVTGSTAWTSLKSSVPLLTLAAGQTLTINGKVHGWFGAGIDAPAGTLTINNVGAGKYATDGIGGGVALNARGATVTINGNITGYVPAIYQSGGTVTINGNIYAYNDRDYTCVQIVNAAATLILNGLPLTMLQGGTPLLITAGTVRWGGTRSLAAGELAFIRQSGGTLDLSDNGSGPLVLANAGKFLLLKNSGTLVSTGARVVSAASAQALIALNSGTLSAPLAGGGARRTGGAAI